MKRKKAVILLSGGLDSTTVLAIAASMQMECYCISFDYGQKHSYELECAREVVRGYGTVATHKIIKLDSSAFLDSALTCADVDVPKHDNVDHLQDGEVSITYVPARNTVFLSYALGYAEVIKAEHIFIGCNAIDYSNYPDCRPEYIDAFQNLIDFALANRPSSVKLHAPLMNMSKAEIIKKGKSMGVDYSITTSCYEPQGKSACGRCEACLLRKAGFAALGIQDPARYII